MPFTVIVGLYPGFPGSKALTIVHSYTLLFLLLSFLGGSTFSTLTSILPSYGMSIDTVLSTFFTIFQM